MANTETANSGLTGSNTSAQQSSGSGQGRRITGTAKGPGQDLRPAQDLVEYVRRYAREKPDVAALWCFGLGIVVGWKAKPW